MKRTKWPCLPKGKGQNLCLQTWNDWSTETGRTVHLPGAEGGKDFPKNVKCGNECAQKKLTVGKMKVVGSSWPRVIHCLLQSLNYTNTENQSKKTAKHKKQPFSYIYSKKTQEQGWDVLQANLKLHCDVQASLHSPTVLQALQFPNPHQLLAPHSSFLRGGPSSGSQKHCHWASDRSTTAQGPQQRGFPSEKKNPATGYPANSTCRIQRETFWGPSLSYNLLLGCSQRKESSYQQAILCTIYTNTLHHKKVVCFLRSEKQECWVPCHASYFMRQKEGKK